ncbi:MAG: SusC/RagA family TonB-linked outer membrane protein [Ginsengibacter sp.]
MKFTVFFMFLFCVQAHAKTFGQENITLSLKSATIKQLIKEVEKQTPYRFVYHTGSLPLNKVDIQVVDGTLQQVLGQAFKGLPIDYSVKDNNLVVLFAPLPGAEMNKTIKGRVLSSENKPLEGVTVMVAGTRTGVVTNSDGYYTIDAPDNAQTLSFSLVGYAELKISISGRSQIDVTLKSITTSLDEVVVTGYTNYAKSQTATASTTIKADKINQVPMTIDQLLQGRVPGLVVSSGSGQPGQSAKITIRGVGTIEGPTDVLYVLDGVPIENGYFQAINPSDIESMTVLKDASGKSLYGSRGSNGVIVITSKKGKAGKLSFNYKSQYGFSDLPTPTFKMMNASEHLLFEEQIGQETGSTAGPGWTYSPNNPKYAAQTPEVQQRYNAILDSLKKVNTDWRNFFFQKGKFMEQQIDASGGSEKVQFYSSLNYYNQDGIAVRSGLKRVTLRNNVNFHTNKLSGNLNVSIGYSSSSFIEAEGGSSGNNPLSAVYYALPYEYPYAPDGTLVTSGNSKTYPVMDQREGSNAYERLLNTSNKTSQLKSMVSSSLQYEIFNGLTAKTQVGIDYRQSLDEAFVNPDSYSGSKVSNGKQGSFGEGSRRNFSVISTSGLTYARKIASVHDFDITALFEYNYNNYRSFGYTGYGIEGRLPNTPAGITPGSATSGFIPSLSGGRTENALASYIGIGRYTYNGKYTVNLSYRYDGASTLPAENRWHPFYSAGINWNVKKENFLENVAFLSDFRLRASYGTTASPVASDFDYIALFSTTSYGGNAGIKPDVPGNKNYNWEYAKELNIGTDLSILNNRMRLILDIYDRKTTNLIFLRPLSITSGFSEYRINGGSVDNKGIEIDLQGDLIRNKNLKWTVGGNIAYNKNKVTDLGGSDEFEIGYTGIIRVGLPLGTHYAPEWAGVDPATGMPQYIDPATGKATFTYNAATMSVAKFGSYNPGYTGGAFTSLSYKDLSLNVLFSFVGDVKRYDNEMYYNENPSFKTSNQTTRMLYDRWQKPGDIALLPDIKAKRSYSSFDIYDASFVRLRNVNLRYKLSDKIVSKLKGLSGVQLFVQGENLYTWTKWIGFDPENGNEYSKFAFPNPRTYTAGININF